MKSKSLALAAWGFVVCGMIGAATAQDRPLLVRGDDFSNVIEFGIEQARASLAEAQMRYFNELQERADFYCAVRLADDAGHIEQVFVKVRKWDVRIVGNIASPLQQVTGYAAGQLIGFDYTDILDWLIKYKDGSEEGNFIGRALADLEPR